MEKNNKGQVTIFIIIALIIVAAVVLFLVFRQRLGDDVGKLPDQLNARTFLEICLEDRVYEVLAIIGEHGGYIDPTVKKYKNYQLQGEQFSADIAYLCYNKNNYGNCVNQEPLLLEHIEQEIKNNLSFDVRDCFDKLGNSLQNDGYVVNAVYKGFELTMKEKEIVIGINGSLTLTRADQTTKEENLEIKVPSEFYQLSRVVQEIVSQESKYCTFSIIGYSIFYPKWEIRIISTSDDVLIYRVENKKTNELFKFAIEGCVRSPGLG